MAINHIGKILIVDDELELKNILVEALNCQGYEASGFTSPKEALEFLREQPFDILITDLMMPGMDGLTLVREGLQIDPNLVCIVMTGQGTIQTAVDAMKGGTFDYVLKPFRLQTMIPVLTRAMNTRHLRLENIQLREAVAIHELCETIAFTLDPKTILSKLADAALLQSEADEVSVLMPVEGREEFYVAAVRGEERERLLGERIPFGNSVASWVAREGEALILDGEITDERFVSLWPRPEIRSSLSIPMLVSQKLVGVLNLNAINRPRRFTLGQMKALSILAGTAAAALESASLYVKVQEAEREYRSIFENAAEGIWRTTPAGRLLTANPAMAHLLGYDTPEELVSSVTDLKADVYVDPSRRDEFRKLIEMQSTVNGFQASYRRRDGGAVVLSVSGRAIRDESGEILYYDGIAEDVTASTRAIEQLKQSEKRFRQLADNINEVFWVFDSKAGEIIYVSPAYENIWGRPIEELWRDFDSFLATVHPDDRHLVVKGRERQARGETCEDEYRIVRPDGSIRWILDRAFPVRDENGEVTRIVGIAQDITERKADADQLRQAKEFSDKLIQTANVIILGLDSEGRVDIFNQTAESITGYTAAELRGQNWFEKLTPRDRYPEVWNEFNRLVLGDAPRTFENPILTKNGEERYIMWQNNQIVVDGKVVGTISFGNDITERRQVEAALRESEERYRDLVENAHDIIYSHDLQGKYVSSNRASEEITGYTHEESLKMSFTETIAPEFLDKARDMLARKIAGEHITAYELEIIAKDGTRIPVEVNTRLLMQDGKPIGVTGIARDVTERKRAEAQLRFQKSLLQAQTEASVDGVLVVSPTNQIISHNERLLELWGLPKESLVGRSDEGTLSAVLKLVASPDEFLARVKYLYEHPDETSQEEIGLNDGRTFDRHSAPVHGPDGEYYGRVWFFRDISEPKRAEAELTRLGTVVEQTAESVVITGRDGIIEYVNPAFERISGYAKQEAVGKNPRFLKSGKTPPPIYRELWDTITRGDVWVGALINKKKDGTIYHERATISPMVDEVGNVTNYIAVKQDITHEMQLEEQLRQSQKMEAIGQLAGGVAHDFNNLLTAINGYSSLALQKIDETNPLKGYLEEIKKAGDRASNLTRQLLAFGRKQILQPLPINLNDVVTDMNKMLKRLIGEDIVLTAKLDPELKKIQADPGQIEQVLVNLVVNARDAMPNGGDLTIETSWSSLILTMPQDAWGWRPATT